jgi:uncharacterized YigZ family protein
MAGYPVPARQATAEIREKGSRFLAVVFPVAAEAEARDLLAACDRQYAGASHVCWAQRLGWPARERSADAGEPSGTAGAPILRVLRGAGLSDALLIVVRWFGGIKLGKGGLARAYSAAAKAALAELPITQRVAHVRLVLAVPLRRLGAVKRLIHPPEVQMESERYGIDGGGANEAGEPTEACDAQAAGVEKKKPSAEIVLRVEEGRQASLEELLTALGIAHGPARVAEP